MEENGFTIGRSKRASLRVEDSKVSRIHCKIIPVDEGFILVDLDSRNGTFLNNEPVKKKEIKAGDKIKIGNSLLIFDGKEAIILKKAVKSRDVSDDDVTESRNHVNIQNLYDKEKSRIKSDKKKPTKMNLLKKGEALLNSGNHEAAKIIFEKILDKTKDEKIRELAKKRLEEINNR